MARKGKKKLGTAPQGFPDKLWNKLSVEWRDSAASKQTEELEKDIITSVRGISEQTANMKEDPKIIVLSEDLKALKGGYTEVIAGDKAKLEYCLFLMTSRGVKVTKPKLPKLDDEDEEEEDSDE